jgi:uncharacterized protein (DUF362 family)
MKSGLSRREFLKLAATGLASVAFAEFLAGCSPQASEEVRPTATNEPPDTPAAAATSTEVPPSPTAFVAPDLVVVRGGQPEEMVQRALASLGGLTRFISPGAKVVLKPNICVGYRTYEYAATTNPWVVGALVKACLEAGAGRVTVMDFPFGGTAQEAYRNSGIQEQVEAAGGQMEQMMSLKFVDTPIPAGQNLQSTRAYQDALEADLLIDVPIAKQHGATRLSLGMKNLMGLVWNRETLHRSLHQCIADLTSLFRPRLTVVDAVRVLLNNGPTGGNLGDVRQLDTLIASPDIVAADSYAAFLFGIRPEQIGYISIGASMGLGRMDLENLSIQEINLGAG